VSAHVVVRPGRSALVDWRALYRGASVKLDPIARADVEAGAAGLAAALGRGGTLGESTAPAPSVVDFIGKGGDVLPAGLVRLLLALKVASLGQGMSGVRWAVIEQLGECLARDILPVIPDQNAADRLALSHVFGLLTGTADVVHAEKRRSAAKALKKAGLAPLPLAPSERSALLSGAQASTAFALAGLFEAERLFQSSLVTFALSSDRMTRSARRRVHRLRRYPGEIEVARTLELLSDESPECNPSAAGAPAIGGYRMTAQLGACFDLLRCAGRTLEAAGNAVSEQPLVVWQTAEIVPGAEDTSAIELAADLTALALCEIGLLAERRMTRPQGGPERPEEPPVVMAGGFNAENRRRALPLALGLEDDEGRPPTHGGVRRLLSAAGTAALVLAIELLTISDSENDVATGPLGRVRELLRDRMPSTKASGPIAPSELAAAAELIRSGALVEACGIEFPEVAPGNVMACGFKA
jgi:histidine ammonia-lyase